MFLDLNPTVCTLWTTFLTSFYLEKPQRTKGIKLLYLKADKLAILLIIINNLAFN